MHDFNDFLDTRLRDLDPHKAFARYVRRRLDDWGHEFWLGRDLEPLGHRSKDMLQVLIEHKGQMPPPQQGWKPDVNVTPLGWQTECIVTAIHREAPLLACVLRAYYCGSGRRGVERYEIAQELSGQQFSRRTYFNRHDLAFAEAMRHFLAASSKGEGVVIAA